MIPYYEVEDSELDSTFYEYTELYTEEEYKRNFVNTLGVWNQTFSQKDDYEYFYKYKDIMIAAAEYERDVEGGKVSGKLGATFREENEKELDSVSEFENGKWVLQEGTAYERNASQSGDYAEGEGEYENSGTLSGETWSYTGNITEMWKDISGTGQRTDYHVVENEWEIDDEWSTSVSTFEYLFEDIAEGTKQDSVMIDPMISTTTSSLMFFFEDDGYGVSHTRTGSISSVPHVYGTNWINAIGNYKKSIKHEIHDKTEVKTNLDDNGMSQTKGERKVREIEEDYKNSMRKRISIPQILTERSQEKNSLMPCLNVTRNMIGLTHTKTIVFIEKNLTVS